MFNLNKRWIFVVSMIILFSFFITFIDVGPTGNYVRLTGRFYGPKSIYNCNQESLDLLVKKMVKEYGCVDPERIHSVAQRLTRGREPRARDDNTGFFIEVKCSPELSRLKWVQNFVLAYNRQCMKFNKYE